MLFGAVAVACHVLCVACDLLPCVAVVCCLSSFACSVVCYCYVLLCAVCCLFLVAVAC